MYLTSAQLPDPVASHFAMDGRANNRMSRDAYQLFMTGMTLAVPLILYTAQAMLPRLFARFINIPRRDYWLATPERRAQMLDYLERHALITGLAPPLFFAGIQWLVVDATAIEPARVKVMLKAGKTIEVKSDTIKGSPQEPMSEDELLNKFRGCLEFGVGAKRADANRLADAVMNLETATNAAGAIVGAFPASK